MNRQTVPDQATGVAVKQTILLVDDDPVTQLFIRVFLEEEEYSVEIESNGSDALAALERGSFDCILMDIHMPIMDGLEATRQIRNRNDALRDIPIIAVTAYADDEHREGFLQAGMDDFLAKPVSRERLLAAIKRTLPPY
jgi:CheY-like chemotaxis protein